GRDDRHRDGGEDREEREREDPQRLGLDRRDEQEAAPRPPPPAMDEADRKGAQLRATAVGVRVLFAQAQKPLAPAEDQPDGERGDDERDRGFGRLLDRLRQVLVEQQYGHAEGEERRGVPEAPGGAEACRDPGGVLAGAGARRR